MNPTRHLLAAARALLVLTLALGIAYPLTMTAVATLVPGKAQGSMIRVNGRDVGSSLLAARDAGPQWFAYRPSTVDHDGSTSGGSNLGPSSPVLAQVITDRAKALRAANPDAPAGPIPADALTASASGLDPDISPAYARWQAPRVATARKLPLDQVLALIDAHTSKPGLGILGQPCVNVTDLNTVLATTR